MPWLTVVLATVRRDINGTVIGDPDDIQGRPRCHRSPRGRWRRLRQRSTASRTSVQPPWTGSRLPVETDQNEVLTVSGNQNPAPDDVRRVLPRTDHLWGDEGK